MSEEQVLIDYLREIRGGRLPLYVDSLPEELQWESPRLDIPSEEEEYLEVDHIAVQNDQQPVCFSAFLDGVQRTQRIPYAVTLPNGAKVPIHVAHIAAGVVVREEKRLRFVPELCEDRYLLLMPYEGIRDAGGTLREPPLIRADENLECLKKHRAFWCDTTHPGLVTPQPGESSFIGEKLLETARIRARAQTRVGVWRQLLELFILKRFVEEIADDWILVDGPLYYDFRWAPKLDFDVAKAKKVVGYIRAIRERPPDLTTILKLKLNERSRVRLWPKIKVPKMGRGEEEEGSFLRRHLKWYIRQRVPPGWSPPDDLGLVAIDIDIATLGIRSSDDPSLTLENFVQHRPMIDSITLGVWRERYPGPAFPRDLSYYVRLYPVEKLEQALHSRLLPHRMLATLGLGST